MKKLLLGLVAVVVVATAGAPYVNGLIMERTIKHSYANANTMYGEMGNGVSLEIVKYHRGYLSSNFTSKIHLGELQRVYGIKEIEVVNTARHGITGATLKTHLEKNKWYADFIDKKLGGKDPLHITTQYNLFGNFRTAVKVDGFSLPVQKDTVVVKPLNLHLIVSSNLKRFATEGSWQGLTVPGKTTVGELSVKGRFHKISTLIWAGKYNFALKSIESTEGREPIKMANLKAEYKMNYDKKTNSLGFDTSYGVDSISSKQKKMMDDGFVRFGIDRIDANGYEQLIKTYASTLNTVMKSAALAGRSPNAKKQFVQTQMGLIGLQMMTASERVLKKGLKIRVEDLKATLPQGNVAGNFVLALKQDISFPQLGMVAQDPSVALKLFSLHSDISLPEKLVSKAHKLTTPFFPGMKTGLFVKKGDRLVNKADTKDGKLILNGQELAL